MMCNRVAEEKLVASPVMEGGIYYDINIMDLLEVVWTTTGLDEFPMHDCSMSLDHVGVAR